MELLPRAGVVNTDQRPILTLNAHPYILRLLKLSSYPIPEDLTRELKIDSDSIAQAASLLRNRWSIQF